MRIDKKKLQITAIMLILLTAFLIRFIPVRMAHFWDETVYLQHAEILFSGRTNFDEFSFRPPLLSIIFFFGFFVKHSVISASIITAALGTLAVLFLFLIGKKLYGFKTGVIAGLIFAFAPFVTLNSNYLLTDVPVVTFMAISFYLSLFRKKKIFIFLSGIFFSLAILMKFTAVLMIFVFLLYFLFRKFKLKEIIIFGIGSALIMLPYLLLMQIKYGNFLMPFIKGQQLVGDRNEHILFYFFKIPKAFTILAPVGLIFWFIFILIRIKKKEYRHWKRELLMLFWAMLFLLYLTKVPHKELRYILPIAVPIVLLASCGLCSIIEKTKKQYRILAWLLFIGYLLFLISSTYAWENIKKGQFVDYTKTDEMKIADYLREINYSGIIYTNTRWPVLAYYTGLETKLLMPWDQRVYSEYENVMKEKGILIGLFGEKYPDPGWLDKNPKFKHLNNIGGFFIYEYTPENNNP